MDDKIKIESISKSEFYKELIKTGIKLDEDLVIEDYMYDYISINNEPFLVSKNSELYKIYR